jgi:protein-disulfide isomerase
MPRGRARTTTSRKSAKLEAFESIQGPSRRKFNFSSLPKFNIVYLLGLLLVVASFLLGVLFTKVQYLEGGTRIAANNETANDNNNIPQEPVGPVDVEQGHLPILGNEDAKVTVVEFSDFQCPFCKSLFDESLAQIKSEYVDTGKVKFAYRHYPLTDIHPNAQKSAEASECANEQGNFWGYHDELFKNQDEWGSLSATAALEKYVEYANNLGLNGEALRECVNSGEMAEKVNEDLDAGSAVGVNGTPATFVNGYLVSGAVPFSEFKTLIDQELAK